MLDYEKFTFKSEKLFDRKIWSKFHVNTSCTTALKNENKSEFLKLKEYSEHLIKEHFNKVETELQFIRKINFGYLIHRKSFNKRWIVKIGMKTNQIEIKKSI